MKWILTSTWSKNALVIKAYNLFFGKVTGGARVGTPSLSNRGTSLFLAGASYTKFQRVLIFPISLANVTSLGMPHLNLFLIFPLCLDY